MPFIGNKPTAVPLTGDDIQDGTIGIADLSATGTKDSTTFLRGDNTFQTVSSDYVRLATVTPSGVSSVSIDGYFTSDYDYYELVGYDIFGTTGATLRGRFNVGGSQQAGSDYDWSFIASYVSSGASGGANNNAGAWKDTDWRFHYNNMGTAVSDSGFIKMKIFNPLGSSYKEVIFNGRSSNSGSAEISTTMGGARWASTSATSGVSLFLNLGTFGSGTTFILYGVK